LAIALPAVFFFALPPLSQSGLWDPYELNVADLARRIALNLHGASQLALDGADNSLPHLNDLGRPQLPFSSIALGFKFLGLHEWAGRAPLALWGLLGVWATYAFVARLFDRKAGLYAAVALTSMPLYFVQARAMLGDICAMSALALSFGGLAVAVFDRNDRGPTDLRARGAWLAMAAAGLAAGFFSRGGILGLALPLLGVGIAWALSRVASSGSMRDGLGDAVGAVALGTGLLCLGMGLRPYLTTPASRDLSLWVGAIIKPQGKYPTFDFYIATVGHALVPWSAFLPFAAGRLFAPPTGPTGAAAERESLGRVALLVGASAALVAHGFLASRTEPMAFVGPCLIAAICGVALRDFERGAHASVAVGVGTALLLAVFHHDFHELPEKAYQAYAIVGASFPESFKAKALLLWWVVLGSFAGVAFLTWVERDSKRAPFDPKTYSDVLKGLRHAFDGLLALGYAATVGGAGLAALMVWIGGKRNQLWVSNMSLQLRDASLNGWWLLALVPLGVVLGVLFACDLWLFVFDRSRRWSTGSFARGLEPFGALVDRLRRGEWRDPGVLALVVFLGPLVPVMTGAALVYSGAVTLTTAIVLALPSGVLLFVGLAALGDVLRHRATGLVFAGACAGALACFSFYPALANQVSPKEVFETYRRLRKPGEPLALLGVGGRTAAYYAGGPPTTHTDAQNAFRWLTAAEPGSRRFVALKAEELPRLNQLFRETSEPRANLPVIDARSSQILLAVSTLLAGEGNDNPLGRMLLSSPPKPQRVINANMDDRLLVLGIDIADLTGKAIESVAPGRRYTMRIYYRVLAAVGGEWEAFLHIDGYRRRHNGDHKPMGGKYPMNMWLKEDLLVDEHEFALEPNFTPGNYTIYFGLFVGETRMKVKSGPNDNDNRVDGGPLRVQ
jgi:4-amino-4-deoxy-L-arabinose transferase-like glycosyltransferase